MLLPVDITPLVSVSVVPTFRSLPKVNVPVDVLLTVNVDSKLVVPGVVTSKLIVPNEPVPFITIPELVPPLNLPEPEMVLFTEAFPTVST